MMHRSRFVAALAASLALGPVAALAGITPGTALTGTMNQNLSSNHAQVGQTFTLSDVHSSNHDVNGATIYGHVAKVQAAGQGTPGRIVLAFDKVNTRSGNVYRITGHATNVKVDTKSNAGKELAGGAAGALVGGLIGGGVGAVLGAGGGALYAKNNRQNVNIPQGSLVTMVVDSNL
jgi:protein tyrosine phosphatase (PTP) superfamily phosphohydrolase (DUF442 family)